MSRHLRNIFILLLGFPIWINAQDVAEEVNVVAAPPIPVHNLIKYNRFIANPTFSFVRQRNRSITAYNRNQWGTINDSPQVYVVNYSGRVNDNMGLGIGLFQQNFGVFRYFGGNTNYAYNVELNRDMALTFGANLNFYQSGIKSSLDTATEQSGDPLLQNYERSSQILFGPGANFNFNKFDVGVYAANLVGYDISSGATVPDVMVLKGHVMYTHHLQDDDDKEVRILGMVIDDALGGLSYGGSAIVDFTRLGWLQASYNSFYGVSGGIGANIIGGVAIGYAAEKTFGDFGNFGLTHEFSLAYNFGEREASNRSRRKSKKIDQEPNALDIEEEKSKKNEAPVPPKRPMTEAQKAAAEAKLEQRNKLRQQREAQEAKKAEDIRKAAAEINSKSVEQLRKEEAEKAAAELARIQRIEAERKAEEEKQAQAELDRKRRIEAEKQAQAELEEKRRLEAERKAAAELERVRRIEAENKAEEERKAAAELERIRRIEAEKKAEEERQAKAAAELERVRRIEAEKKAEEERAAAELQRIQRIEEEKKAEEERKAKAELERIQRIEAEKKVEEERAAVELKRVQRIEAEKKEEEEKAAAELKRVQRIEAEKKAEEERAAAELKRIQRIEAEKKAEAERQAREELERIQRIEAEKKAEAERQRLEAERKAEEERIRQEEERQRLEAERKAEEERIRQEEERQRLEAERKAEEERIRQEEERKRVEAEKKAEEERQRLEAERKAEEERQRREAERKAEEERRLEAERKAQEDLIRIRAEQKAKEERAAAELKRKREEERRAGAELKRINQLKEQKAAMEAELKRKSRIIKDEPAKIDAEIKRKSRVILDDPTKVDAEIKRKSRIIKNNDEGSIEDGPTLGSVYNTSIEQKLAENTILTLQEKQELLRESTSVDKSDFRQLLTSLLSVLESDSDKVKSSDLDEEGAIDEYLTAELTKTYISEDYVESAHRLPVELYSNTDLRNGYYLALNGKYSTRAEASDKKVKWEQFMNSDSHSKVTIVQTASSHYTVVISTADTKKETLNLYRKVRETHTHNTLFNFKLVHIQN